jgi:L-ribulose-5-phosphate 3-epimerase
MSAFACNTYSYMRSHTAEACLGHLADLGFRNFELMMHPGHAWPAEMDSAARLALRRAIDARGLRLVSLNMPNIDLNIAGASHEMRSYTLRILRGVVQMAEDLGAPGIVMVPGKHNPLFPDDTENLARRFYHALALLGPLARRAGVGLWIENVPFAFEATTRGLMDLLERYGDETLGITFDVANAHFIGEDIGEALACCAPRLKLVHLSDTSREIYRHDPVGNGTVPFPELPTALARIGHRQAPVLEVISRDPDRDILASRDRLIALGFPAQTSAN